MSNVCQSIRSRLEGERDRIHREIRDYPTPIPRCDAQFNYLLEQRDSIARELQRFESVVVSGSTADASRLLEAFVSEADLGDAVKRDLRSIVTEDRAELESR
ncbi:MAG TPA: hypothetical protein VEN29_01690 [Casimicrobiaceae bacterium]|nr:hypothetical protein [Casimicrobiaceae bacterium]